MGIHYRVYNIRSITFRNNRKQMSSWLSSSGQIQPSVGEADQRANLAGDHGRGVCKTVCNLAGLLWYYITTSHPFLRQFRQDSAVPPLTEGIDHPSECSSSERRACPFKRHDTNAGAECRLAERQHIANQCQYMSIWFSLKTGSKHDLKGKMKINYGIFGLTTWDNPRRWRLSKSVYPVPLSYAIFQDYAFGVRCWRGCIMYHNVWIHMYLHICTHTHIYIYAIGSCWCYYDLLCMCCKGPCVPKHLNPFSQEPLYSKSNTG